MSIKVSILGCGWIGLELGRYLNEKNYKVKGSGTSLKKLASARHVIQPYEITLPEALKKESFMTFLECDVLVITVPPALKLKGEKRSLSCYVVDLMDRVADSGVKNVIYLGSTAVYGDADGFITEETTPETCSERATNLLYIEQQVWAKKTLSPTILRCAGLVGYNREPGKFLAGKVNVPDPDMPVNIIHRDDCIQIIEEIVALKRWGEIYNLCTDLHPLKKEFYLTRALKAGLTPPTFSPSNGKKTKIISNQKIIRDLDYKFKYPDPMQMP